MSLNNKQIRFCEEFVIHHNASKAAASAGYSTNNSKAIGYQLRNNPEIDNYIKQLEKERQEELGINRTALLIESNKIAKINIKDFMTISHYEKKIDNEGNDIEVPIYRIKHINELTDDQTACIKKYHYDKDGILVLEFWDKQRSIADMLKAIDPNEEKEVNNLSSEDIKTLQEVANTIEKFKN